GSRTIGGAGRDASLGGSQPNLTLFARRLTRVSKRGTRAGDPAQGGLVAGDLTQQDRIRRSVDNVRIGDPAVQIENAMIVCGDRCLLVMMAAGVIRAFAVAGRADESRDAEARHRIITRIVDDLAQIEMLIEIRLSDKRQDLNDPAMVISKRQAAN